MFVTIRSYNSSKKAEYIKYRLERAGIKCNTVPQKDKNDELKEIFAVEVHAEQTENAVNELIKIKSEYPSEDFELKTDPKELLQIIIPIDFSEKSFEACKYAIDIAIRRPVEIKLIHVWNDELDDTVAVRNSYMMEDFKRMQRGELKRNIRLKIDAFSLKLHSFIEETNTQNKLLFHFTIVEGIVHKQIAKAVQLYRPHLVLIGHNDQKDFEFRISREVANTVIDLAYCPVFYIPQKVYYKPFNELHIMYATNFDKNDLLSFNTLQQLSSGYKTHIHYLHIVHEEEAKIQSRMKDLIQKIDKINSTGIKIHSDIVSDNILLNGFTGFIKKNHIDMLSFTSPEYGVWHKLFNPDNLRSIMNGSTLPLLIFRYRTDN